MTGHADTKPTPIRVGFIPLTDCAPLVMAVLEAARIMAGPDYIHMPVDLIEGRLRGQYRDGLGRAWDGSNPAVYAEGFTLAGNGFREAA